MLQQQKFYEIKQQKQVYIVEKSVELVKILYVATSISHFKYLVHRFPNCQDADQEHLPASLKAVFFSLWPSYSAIKCKNSLNIQPVSQPTQMCSKRQKPSNCKMNNVWFHAPSHGHSVETSSKVAPRKTGVQCQCGNTFISA